MAFNMNGSPLNKLNLFRKGRGKEYRQTKRAIKRQIRKTGGFEATAGADGQFTVTGGSGAARGDQSGRTRRQIAREAAEQMTAGIDDKAALGGSDSQKWTGSIGAKSKSTKDYTGDRGGGSWQGTGEKAGVTTTTSRTVDVTGPTVENVRGQITELEKDNPKVSMKEQGFKMKYSPFNQGFGSPLNWNERSPLNNLKKDDKLVSSTEGVYMKEGASPLNQTEAECKSPKVWRKGKCWTASEWRTEQSEETTDDDITVTTTKSERDLETGTEGSEETEDIEAKEGCSKFTYSKCCNSGTKGGFKNNSAGCKKCQTCKAAKSDEELAETKQSECAQKGEGWKWDASKKTCVKKTEGDSEKDVQEKLESEAKGTATIITSVTDCPNDGEGYELKDGKCIKKAGGGVSDTGKARTKKCRCKGEVTEIPRSQDCPPCEKEPKEKKCPEGKELIDGRCKRIKEEKEKTCGKGKELVDGKCKRIKDPKKDKDCKCLEWDCE